MSSEKWKIFLHTTKMAKFLPKSWNFLLINFYIHCILILFPVLVLGQGGGGLDGSDGIHEKIDYAKLDLDTKILRGSRWSIEQRKEHKMIEVFHAVELVDISKVDVDTMSIRIEIHMRQRWQAEELIFPEGLFEDDDPPETFIQADPKILTSLWSPDSFIPLARDTKIASFTVVQNVVNIFRNKTIIYKARLYTILGCVFDFRWYPLDKQVCALTIESYTTTDDLVSYRWETNQLPVVVTSLKLLQYDLNFPMKSSNGSMSRWGRSGSYPYVQLDFEFERQLGHHMIQVFIPTTLVVILSWFSFWLGLDAIPGRISLLITCMLTLVTMHSGMKGAIPPVNYIKMMDIWMVGCMAFVFLALCEFVVVKYVHWRKQQELKQAEEKAEAMKVYLVKVREFEERMNGRGKDISRNKPSFNPYLEFYRNMSLQEKDGMGGGGGGYPYARPAWINPAGGGGGGGMGPLVPMGGGYSEIGPFAYPQNPNDAQPQKRPIWVTVDRISRILFPLSFATFNAVFWPWLLVGAQNQVPGS